MSNIAIFNCGERLLEINLDHQKNLGILMSIEKAGEGDVKWLSLYASAFDPKTLTHTKWDMIRLDWPCDLKVSIGYGDADPGHDFDPHNLDKRCQTFSENTMEL